MPASLHAAGGGLARPRPAPEAGHAVGHEAAHVGVVQGLRVGRAKQSESSKPKAKKGEPKQSEEQCEQGPGGSSGAGPRQAGRPFTSETACWHHSKGSPLACRQTNHL